MKNLQETIRHATELAQTTSGAVDADKFEPVDGMFSILMAARIFNSITMARCGEPFTPENIAKFDDYLRKMFDAAMRQHIMPMHVDADTMAQAGAAGKDFAAAIIDKDAVH